MGCVCAGETGGGTPILAFPREGGREGIGEGGRGDGSPHSRGNGRGARERRGLGVEGVLMGGMEQGG